MVTSRLKNQDSLDSPSSAYKLRRHDLSKSNGSHLLASKNRGHILASSPPESPKLGTKENRHFASSSQKVNNSRYSQSKIPTSHMENTKVTSEVINDVNEHLYVNIQPISVSKRLQSEKCANSFKQENLRIEESFTAKDPSSGKTIILKLSYFLELPKHIF